MSSTDDTQLQHRLHKTQCDGFIFLLKYLWISSEEDNSLNIMQILVWNELKTTFFETK